MDAKKLLQKISPTRMDQLLLALLCLGLIVGVCSQLLPTGSSSNPADPSSDANFEADTLIPEGFVLVPIRLENQQALLAMIGPFAVLNIYQADVQSGSRGKLVAKSIKVMRAPYDPEALSVLAPEDKAALFMGSAQGFYGVLQNRRSDNLDVQKAKAAKAPIPVETFEN